MEALKYFAVLFLNIVLIVLSVTYIWSLYPSPYDTSKSAKFGRLVYWILGIYCVIVETAICFFWAH